MIVSFVFLGLYTVLGIIIMLNIKQPPRVETTQPTISVIVAAKNEQDNIESCVKSLCELDYPADKLEIIIVDDDSKDDTKKIVTRTIQGVENSRLISLKTNEKNFPGKAGAIDKGVANSSGEIIFFTDADCVVKPTWINTLLSHFTEKTGLVGGFTLYEHPDQRQTVFIKNLSTEVTFVSGIAQACATLKRPVSWMGNNLAIRRTAYDQAGGMAGLSNYLVEDFELMRAVITKTRYEIRFTPNNMAHVYSKANETLAGFYRQRKRWASALKDISFGIFALMGVAVVIHGGIAWYLFTNPIFGIALYAVKMFIDSLILWRINLAIKRKTIWINFIGFQLFYLMQLLVFPVLFLVDRKVTWKGVTYDGPPK